MATVDVQAIQPVPSHMRTVPGSVNIPVAKFPSAPKSLEEVDAAKVAASLVNSFNQALDKKDYAALSKLFSEDGYWRDHLALSWVFRTVQHPPQILEYLQSCTSSRDGFRLRKIGVDASTPLKAPKIVPIDASGSVSGIQFFITAETAIGTAVGLTRLVEENGHWKIFTLYTRLEELRGHEPLINSRRPKGAEHGGKPGRKNWSERTEAAANLEGGNEPAVLVVGKSRITLCPSWNYSNTQSQVEVKLVLPLRPVLRCLVLKPLLLIKTSASVTTGENDTINWSSTTLSGTTTCHT